MVKIQQSSLQSVLEKRNKRMRIGTHLNTYEKFNSYVELSMNMPCKIFTYV